MKAIVVAMDKNNGIGADNDLLWQRDLPADLSHFKELTLGKPIIMGRKTFQSIGRALPGRSNIVVSRSGFDVPDGVEVVDSLALAYELAGDSAMVIGGGQLYEQALNDMDILYVTEVDEVFPQASVFFPVIDLSVWQEVTRDHHDSNEKNKYAFDFVTYKRTTKS